MKSPRKPSFRKRLMQQLALGLLLLGICDVAIA